MLNLLADRLSDEMVWRPEVLLRSLTKLENSDDHYLWGVAQYELGEHQKAEQAFRRALELSISHMPALYGLAQISFEMAKVEEGRRWFLRALKYDRHVEKNAVLFQKSLRTQRLPAETLSSIRLWCLVQLEEKVPKNQSAKFEIGKLLFEQSKFETAMPYFESSLIIPPVAREASEYLSYVYETLYKGQTLVEKTLSMAKIVDYRADVFFNLAMACQHELKRLDLSMHLFYLASQEDPNDPGLRFSLEQAAQDILQGRMKGKRAKSEELVSQFFAHFYLGALGVAKRLFFELKTLKFPEEFFSDIPEILWREWILKSDSSISQVLDSWKSSRGPTFLPERRKEA